MPLSPQDSNSSSSDAPRFGLLAIARVKEWEISINEAVSGPDQWIAEIEGPSVYIHFEISSPSIMRKILDFLRPQSGQRAKHIQNLAIGNFNGSTVMILSEDEFKDRFTILIGTEGGAALRVTLTDGDLVDFLGAVQKIIEEL